MRDKKRRLGKNPLEKLKARPSSEFLQSAIPEEQRRGRVSLEKLKKMQVQIDWVQLYEQAVPAGVKKLTKLFISKIV